MVENPLVEAALSENFGECRMVDHMRAPTVTEVSWHLPEGPVTG